MTRNVNVTHDEWTHAADDAFPFVIYRARSGRAVSRFRARELRQQYRLTNFNPFDPWICSPGSLSPVAAHFSSLADRRPFASNLLHSSATYTCVCVCARARARACVRCVRIREIPFDRFNRIRICAP